MISVFYKPQEKIDNIYAAAEKVIMYLYDAGDQNLSLQELRYKIFCLLTGTSKKGFSLAFLPPTDSALLEHAKRVYYQVQVWLGRDDLNPEFWGWKRTSTMFIPVMSNNSIAPEDLLKNASFSI